VNWTKNISFNEDAKSAKAVKGVDVYETSVDTFPRMRVCSVSFQSFIEGLECRKVDHIFDICRLVLVAWECDLIEHIPWFRDVSFSLSLLAKYFQGRSSSTILLSSGLVYQF
jgi:hypothetical protein